jgi:hypothetical protein
MTIVSFLTERALIDQIVKHLARHPPPDPFDARASVGRVLVGRGSRVRCGGTAVAAGFPRESRCNSLSLCRKR